MNNREMNNRAINKRRNWYIVVLILGLCILAAGALLAKQYREATGIMTSLPYLLIGIGAGAFGRCFSELVRLSAYKKNPDVAHMAEIEEHDERNIAISNKAKATAFDIMIYVFGALMLSYALSGADMFIILSLVGAYLLVIGTHIVCMIKYSKEM